MRVARSGAVEREICLVKFLEGIPPVAGPDAETFCVLEVDSEADDGAREAGMKVEACGRRPAEVVFVNCPPNLLLPVVRFAI